jgi:hypothetical protein
MKSNFALLERLKKIAKDTGVSVEDSVKGMSQQWDIENGKIVKVTESINSLGTAVKKYETLKTGNVDVVVGGQQRTLNDAQSMQSTYTQENARLQGLDTNRDSKQIIDTVDTLNRIESAAKRMGVELDKSLSGIEQKYKVINGELYEMKTRIDAAGQSSQGLERVASKSYSGFNALGNSVNQLTREMPAFAISAQTGFLALSNNIPIFVDALQDAFSQGKNGWKQLATSIFSFNTALSVGVTLLTIYGADIIKWILKPSKETQAAFDKLSKEISAFVEIAKKLGSTAGAEISKLGVLFGALENINTTRKEQVDILKTINKDYDKYLSKLGIETVTIKNQTDAYQKLIDKLFQVSIAKSAISFFEKMNTDLIAASVNATKFGTAYEEALDRAGLKAQTVADLVSNMRLDSSIPVAEQLEAALSSTSLETTTTYPDGSSQTRFKIISKEDAAAVAKYYQELSVANYKMIALRGEAKKTADAFSKISIGGINSELGRSLNFAYEVYKKFFSGDVVPESKGKDAIEKKEKDFRQFGDNVIEVTEDLRGILSEDFINPKEFAKGMQVRQDLVTKYLKTIQGSSVAVNKAIDEIAVLDKEQVRLAKEKLDTEMELDKQRRIAIDLIAQGYSVDAKGNRILGTKDQTVAELEKNKAIAKGIALRVQSGEITYEQGVKEIQSSNIALEIVTKNQKSIEDIDKRMEANRKKIEANQAKISAAKADDVLSEQVRLESEREALEREYADQRVKVLAYLGEQEVKAAEESQKAFVQAGLDNFNDYTKKITEESDKSIKELVKLSEEARIQVEALQSGIVEREGDVFKIDFSALGNYLTNNNVTDGQKEAMEKSIGIIQDNAKTSLAIHIRRNADIKNASLQFSEDYLKIYRELNGFELADLEATRMLELQLLKNTQEDKYSILKEEVDNRREQGQLQAKTGLKIIKGQTKVEKDLVRQAAKEALDLAETIYKKELELQVKQAQEEINILVAKGADTTIRQKQLNLKKIELQKAYGQEQLAIVNKYNELLDDVEPVDITSLISPAQDLGNKILEIFDQANQNRIDKLNEDLQDAEERYAETLSRISALEDDLEGKRSGRRDAVLQSLELQRDLEAKLANDKIALARRVAEEERKLQKRQQAAAIANAIINGALAQTNIWATVPKADWGVSTYILSGIAAGVTAAEIGLIASQKFAKGGFTGSGTQRDETGHKVAGVVHNDEWVAPKWMVESPKFGSVINQLENARTRGFADGGFTSPDFGKLSGAVSPNSTARLEAMIESYNQNLISLSNRPIFVSATEVQNVTTNSNRRRANSTL